ncbi:MAG: LysM peptidoglycan-binding domain-containing protein [Pseudoxanthomonas suwonensis]|nr:LysM peptidoglycan-binding domain-containing protein [Pseudoxanthomonas suwonensis]
MSNQNPNDPNNLTLKGAGGSGNKPDFSNTSTGSRTAQGGAGSGADFSNVSIGSSTRQGGSSTGSYTVRSGDTLSAIAQQHLGSASKWRAIYDANRELIGDDPDKIHPGQQLTIPAASGE